jgi:type III restriction enzyme
MPSPINIATFDISLHLSRVLTAKVNEAWQGGAFLESVTPTTKTLLIHWFDDEFTKIRQVNFHIGQKQAILNIIYLHEVLKINSIQDVYVRFDEAILMSFLQSNIEEKVKNEEGKVDEGEKSKLTLKLVNHNFEDFQQELKVYTKFKADILTQKKYSFIKYALKMATATGKTWILNAIIIWQYLNKQNDSSNSRYSNNFLIVAPGLIVYERLLESLKGKNNEVKQSDIIQNQALFVPDSFKESIGNMLSVGVIDKNNINNIKNGCIMVVNWHLFLDEEIEAKEPENIAALVEQILPLKPGKSGGNSLDVLDKKPVNLVKILIEKLDNLMVINDEAHHVHENKVKGKKEAVKWQQAIDLLQHKIKHFYQIDFTATPYVITGSGERRKKHYFPHVVVDFSLLNALNNGLVKLVVMDKSSELGEVGNLNYKAQFNQNGELMLSEGQKTMIKMGLSVLEKTKQRIVQQGYTDKHPKMMITCEDTNVVPLIEKHLAEVEGLQAEAFFAIHSKQKNEIGEAEYQRLKKRLFSLNNDAMTQVVISVLMLKEGFDANDICVIVPLRSTSSSILLEQTIGRGLRLMFRAEPDYFEAVERRKQNHKNAIKGKPIVSHLDVLHIIEHPKFYAEYKKLMAGKEVAELVEGGGGGEFEMQVIKLKQDYQKYDMFFPAIEYQQPQNIGALNFDLQAFEPFTSDEKAFKDLVAQIDKKTRFVSIEIKTENIVDGFSADTVNMLEVHNYQEALADLAYQITHDGKFPVFQNFVKSIIQHLKKYIKNRLFDRNFMAENNSNWQVFYITNSNIKAHIIAEFKRELAKMTTNTTLKPKVRKTYFSTVSEFNWYKKYCEPLGKTIYNFTPYPSHGGGFEKDFLALLGKDSGVLRFVKILEFKHRFATIPYINDKNMMVNYYPDFLVETEHKIYIVETKAGKDMENQNVKSKQRATEKFVENINTLDDNERGEKSWQYVIISDEDRKMIKDQTVSFLQLM